MTSQFFIYGLIDPRPERLGELRYVGQSSIGMKRPRRIHAAKCGSWQKSVRKLDLREEIVVLEEWNGIGDRKKWLDDIEIFFIAYFRMVGADLTNMTDGGTGGDIRVWTPEERAKQSRALKGKKKPPRTNEHREHMSQAALKRPRRGALSTEYRQKISASLMGHAVSEEARAKMRAAKARRRDALQSR